MYEIFENFQVCALKLTMLSQIRKNPDKLESIYPLIIYWFFPLNNEFKTT